MAGYTDDEEEDYGGTADDMSGEETSAAAPPLNFFTNPNTPMGGTHGVVNPVDAALAQPDDPTNSRAAVNRLGLMLSDQSPYFQEQARLSRELQAGDPDYANSRQYGEIVNEKQAANDADAQFGDQMASRALARAVRSRLGLAAANDQSQLTQAHEQVTRNATDDFLARQAPKTQEADQATQAKLAIAQLQKDGRIDAATATALGRTADTLFTAGAHVAGSGYGQTEPGQQMLDAINKALAGRQGGAGTPQKALDAAGKPLPEGQTGTDKATGKKYVVKGGTWVPAAA
jgi:hypothetical protein